jgi:hypothetical protein|tara:strand:+ start:44 stop:619 length:576 start_codon:yes stop_codon:yes gene_type:complete
MEDYGLIADENQKRSKIHRSKEKLIKIQFYIDNETEVIFRLKNHQEYFIKGIIKDVKGNEDPIIYHENKEMTSEEYEMRREINNDSFLFIIELSSREEAIFCAKDIDWETLIPSSYNPIRYFIREQISEELRAEIFERDGGYCKLDLEGCTKKAEEIDHIIPVSRGGLSIKDNLQAACSNCNKKKGNNILF